MLKLLYVHNMGSHLKQKMQKLNMALFLSVELLHSFGFVLYSIHYNGHQMYIVVLVVQA